MAASQTDRIDARAIAQVLRSGWVKAVNVKSTELQELWTLLSAREFLVNKVRDRDQRSAATVRLEDRTDRGRRIWRARMRARRQTSGAGPLYGGAADGTNVLRRELNRCTWRF